MRVDKPIAVVSLILAWHVYAFSSSAVAGDEPAPRSGSIGAPIWPPSGPVLESVAARQDLLYSKRPSMHGSPTWIFPLDLLSTPASLVPRSRSDLQSDANVGSGSTQSPALFAVLSNTFEGGSVALKHGEVLFQGGAFVSASAGIQRESLKKTGKSEKFSSTVTDQIDLPAAAISIAGRIMPGMWLGFFREWRRSFSKTTNEVKVSGRTGLNEVASRRDMARTALGFEYQSQPFHLGLEVSTDNDDRLPSRTYSLPGRLAFGRSYWIGIGIKRTDADDKINSELSSMTTYDVSLGKQLEQVALEIGTTRQSGHLHSDAGEGSSKANILFIRAGWGEMVGLRFLGRLSIKSFATENSNHIVDKGKVFSVDLGLSRVR